MRDRNVAEHESLPSDLPTNLAGALPGDEVVVERILLEIVRTTCFDLGISVGDRLQVEERSAGRIVVRNGTVRPIRIASPYAFFVRVGREGGGDDTELQQEDRPTPDGSEGVQIDGADPEARGLGTRRG